MVKQFQDRNRNFWSKSFRGKEASYRGGRRQRPACGCMANSEGGVAEHERWHFVGRNSKVFTSTAAGASAKMCLDDWVILRLGPQLSELKP